MRKQKGRYYKVIGRVKAEDGSDDFYLLCYSSNKSACKREYIKNGWKGKDLFFETLHRTGA